MLKFLFIPILLLNFVGCNSNSSANNSEDPGVDNPTTDPVTNIYSSANTFNFAANDIEPVSFYGHGECEISNGNIIYKKDVNSNFSSDDYCVLKSLAPYGPWDCGVESYEIDFSQPTPALIPRTGLC